jgi:hypothetical protein
MSSVASALIYVLGQLAVIWLQWRILHKTEQVHIATNSMKDALVAAAYAKGGTDERLQGELKPPKVDT